MFEGVIFDLDGLIVDGEPWQLQSWNDYLKRYQVEIAPEEWEPLASRRAYDIAEILRARYNLPEDPLTMTEEQQALLLDLVNDLEELYPLPGADSAIVMLKDYNLKLAIATPAYKDYVWAVLERLKLDEMVDVLVTGDTLAEIRPSPGPLFACAETFALHPGNCLAIAKDRDGVEAALSAGMRVICVPGPNIPRWRITGADVVLRSLDALNMNTLRSIWFDIGEEPRPQLYRIR
jgi:beta-phosphoglucomutase